MHWSIRYALAVAVALIVFGASLAVAGSQSAAEAPEGSPALFGTEASHVGDRGLYKTALVVVHGERGEYHDMAARYAFERLPDRIMLTGDGRHVPVASFVGEWRSEAFPFDLRAALGLPDVPLFQVPACVSDVDRGLAYSDPERFARQMEACGQEIEAAAGEFEEAMEAWGEELDAAITRKLESWFAALDAPTHQAHGAGWRVSHHEGNETVATTARDPAAITIGQAAVAVGPARDTPFEADGLHHTLPVDVPGPCGWRSTLQDGAQDMFRPITVHGACPPDMGLGFAEVTSVDGPIEMRVSGRDTVDGQRAIVFSEPDDPDRLRLWHVADNPYPLRILTRIEAVPAPVLEEVPDYDPPRFYILHELVEFERGDPSQPLGAPEVPALDATGTPWGPERGAFDHPWPLDTAWQESVEPTSDCREWLQWRQEHPDAAVAEAIPRYNERDDGHADPTVDVTWSILARDGSDAVRVSMTQHTETTTDEPILVRVPQVACSSVDPQGAPTGSADASLPSIDKAAVWMQAFTDTEPTTYAFDRSDTPSLTLWSGPDAPGTAQQEDRLTIDPLGDLIEHRAGSDAYPEPRFSDPAWSPRAGDAWGYGVASTGPWHMPEPTTAASLAAGAAAAGLAVLLFPVAKSVFAAAPFFSRIRKEALLDHPVRGHLADLVQEEPGIHFQEIVRRVAKGRGTTEHHLRKLVDADLLVEQQSSGFTCYFPKGRIDRRIMAAAPLMKSSGARRVMQAIAAQPGSAAQGIAQRLGMAPSTVNHHVKKLRAAGLVEAQRDGRFIVLHASDIGRQAADRFAAAS